MDFNRSSPTRGTWDKHHKHSGTSWDFLMRRGCLWGHKKAAYTQSKSKYIDFPETRKVPIIGIKNEVASWSYFRDFRASTANGLYSNPRVRKALEKWSGGRNQKAEHRVGRRAKALVHRGHRMKKSTLSHTPKDSFPYGASGSEARVDSPGCQFLIKLSITQHGIVQEVATLLHLLSHPPSNQTVQRLHIHFWLTINPITNPPLSLSLPNEKVTFLEFLTLTSVFHKLSNKFKLILNYISFLMLCEAKNWFIELQSDRKSLFQSFIWTLWSTKNFFQI